MGCESSDVVRFDLGPPLQGQMKIAKLKSAHNLPIIGPRDSQCVVLSSSPIIISVFVLIKTN